MAAQTFETELSALINKYSEDNFAETPDFLLAQFIVGCLGAYAIATKRREEWFGRGRHPAGSGGAPEPLAELPKLTADEKGKLPNFFAG